MWRLLVGIKGGIKMSLIYLTKDETTRMIEYGFEADKAKIRLESIKTIYTSQLTLFGKMNEDEGSYLLDSGNQTGTNRPSSTLTSMNTLHNLIQTQLIMAENDYNWNESMISSYHSVAHYREASRYPITSYLVKGE